MVKALEIEIDGLCNEQLHFAPLQRHVRGRFDFMRIGEPMSKIKAHEWPVTIPSQRLGIDPDGTGYIREPLHDGEFAPIKEKIEKMGMKLEPAVQEFPGIDVVTWYFWMQRAVESGLARVVSGRLPDRIEGTPKMNFVLNEPPTSAVDKLTAAIEKQTVMFAKLLERLGEK